MKPILSILIFLSVSLFTEACAQKIDIENIYGVWYRSYEDEKNGVIAYRSKGYDFPKIRGREKMEISKDGHIIEYLISPSDAYLKVKGHFLYCNRNHELIFTFNAQEGEKKRICRIIELDKSIFKIQIISEDKSHP